MQLTKGYATGLFNRRRVGFALLRVVVAAGLAVTTLGPAVVTASAQGGQTSEQERADTMARHNPPEPGFESATDASGFQLQWRVDGTDLEVIMAAPTTGWLSVGFDARNRMQGADIVIGYVDVDGTVMVRDDFGTSPTGHQADGALGGADEVAVVSGAVTQGISVIRFRKPLVATHQSDATLQPGAEYSVIWAFGGNNIRNFSGLHQRRGTLRITL